MAHGYGVDIEVDNNIHTDGGKASQHRKGTNSLTNKNDKFHETFESFNRNLSVDLTIFRKLSKSYCSQRKNIIRFINKAAQLN